MNALTLYQVMMLTCEESELGGSVKAFPLADAKALIAAQRQRDKERGKDSGKGSAASSPGRASASESAARLTRAGRGTPLGRALKRSGLV